MMDDAMGAKRQMLVKRKAPLVVAVEEKLASEDEDGPKAIVCPKCGAQLAVTPENQAYVDGMDLTESEDDAEDED
jgi:hypothetical protein